MATTRSEKTFWDSYNADGHTHSASCPARNGDYSYEYVVTQGEFDDKTNFAVFESEDDAVKLVQQKEQSDEEDPWSVSRRPRYKIGALPRKIDITSAVWVGEISKSTDTIEETLTTDTRDEYEHDVSDQILTEEAQISKRVWKGGDRKFRAEVRVVSTGEDLAGSTLASLLEEMREELARHALEDEVQRAMFEAEERERQAERLAQEAAREAKKARSRIQRLAAKGLPPDHTGPTA